MTTDNKLNKLASSMKSDWDRRIAHDYRFWMSDGYLDDEVMWQSGERDLNLILEGIEDTSSKTLLELGCGVGRLLKPAVSRFAKVIGIDVSAEAIKKAHELIGDSPNLDLYVGNGFDLKPVTDQACDVVYSFAALTSMPTPVIASYLLEVNRISKMDAQVRLQVYLGKPQVVDAKDTLHLRCYAEDNFRKAVEACGFEVESIKELILPFKISVAEMGIVAYVVALRKTSQETVDVDVVGNLLLPDGELEGAEWKGSDLEYWMAINYAKELLAKGDVEQARNAIGHAIFSIQETRFTVENVLGQLQAELNEKGKLTSIPKNLAPQTPSRATFKSEIFEKNLRVLKDRFPELHAKIVRTDFSPDKVTIASTPEGVAISFQGQCLDHQTKPVSAAQAWVKKLWPDARIAKAKRLVVVGFGSGYHIQELVKNEQALCVAEPSEEVFLTALGLNDLSSALTKIESLSVGTVPHEELFDSQTEIVIRPQTQAVAANYVAEVRSRFYGTRGLVGLRPNIAILGPFQGGTLPMSAYTSMALRNNKQRVRDWVMHGFTPGYHLLGEFVRHPTRKGIVEGNYLEMVSQLLLESESEKPIDILICMAQAPISGRALTELRNRGVTTVLWFVEDYMRFGYWKDMARYYDFVFTIQKDECISAIKAAGAGEVHYLPVGCDPNVHGKVALPDAEHARWGSPISFVGAGYHNRQQLFASLADMPIKLWGTEWPECRPFDNMVQENGRRLTPDEYVRIFNSTDININLHSSSEKNGVDPFGDFVNPRTFELASCGAFQLVDERKLLPEVFEPGKEVITFKDRDDLREKIDYYLARPEERTVIAERGQERALRDHTYAQRMRQMLAVIYSSRYDRLKQRIDNNPWSKLLQRSKINPELRKRCEESFERGEEPVLDGLVSDIVNGKGRLSETEQKLLFLFHVRKQIIHMGREEVLANK